MRHTHAVSITESRVWPLANVRFFFLERGPHHWAVSLFFYAQTILIVGLSLWVWGSRPGSFLLKRQRGGSLIGRGVTYRPTQVQ